MRRFIKWLVLVAALMPAVASAGIKWKDCLSGDFLEWKEYLVGGTQGAPGNVIWGKGTVGTCGIELWDLTLVQATAQTPDQGYVAKYVTTYDNGFLGTLLGPYANVVWNVSGTVTAQLDAAGLMHSILDLHGTSATVANQYLEAQIETTFDPTLIGGPECINNQVTCQPGEQYTYIGGHQGNSSVTSSFVQVVPEPGGLALVLTAMLAAGSIRRSRGLRKS
jgi:hypothetical protein